MTIFAGYLPAEMRYESRWRRLPMGTAIDVALAASSLMFSGPPYLAISLIIYCRLILQACIR